MTITRTDKMDVLNKAVKEIDQLIEKNGQDQELIKTLKKIKMALTG